MQVNNGIVFTDQLQSPGPHDVTAVIREVENSKEAVFVVSADISAAHRRVKVRKADSHLLACKSSSDSPVIWVNKVGTFGLSSAPYYWTRLFGLVGRLVARVLLREWLYQVIYVDDLHLAAVGPRWDLGSFCRCGCASLCLKLLVRPLRITSLRVDSRLNSWVIFLTTATLRLASLQNVASGCWISWLSFDGTISPFTCGDFRSSWGGLAFYVECCCG